MPDHKDSNKFPFESKDIIAHLLSMGIVALASWAIQKITQINRNTLQAFLLVLAVEIVVITAAIYISWHFFYYRGIVRKFQERTEAHHLFTHHTRDLLVILRGPLRERPRTSPIVPEEHHDQLKRMLRKIHQTFQFTVPQKTKLFVSIRERREDEYHTIIRIGDITDEQNEMRQAKTIPLHRKSGMVDLLWERFSQGDCVLITGTNSEHWQKMPNDDQGMTRSVMLGAVFTKNLLSKKPKERPEFTPIQLEWILCVAADQSNVFKEHHKPLLKCFNDGCGLLLNTWLHNPESANASGV